MLRSHCFSAARLRLGRPAKTSLWNGAKNQTDSSQLQFSPACWKLSVPLPEHRLEACAPSGFLNPPSRILAECNSAGRTDPEVYAPGALPKGEILMNQIIDAIEKEQQKADANTFKVGDSVRVHTRVVEGDKERIQIFAGVVIGRKGRGLNETFTVRRISYGEGVERVFPLHSPRIAKIEVEQEGRVRRARLNYLRARKGKEATAVRE
jgi:large subunit ribosomal protein L19